ncbi:BrnT family toxin [uncultured Sphingomonas sp.]|uniref:BrnT family toxin n=1 Tax=uncultured Sphingomonas sp. TaxID=158754 RepID=UPI0035CBBF50
MDIAYDPAKDAINIAKHGLSLSEFAGFDDTPKVIVDYRRDYGEVRFQARGRIAGRPFCLVYVETLKGIRIISLRRAHEKEIRRYEQAVRDNPGF